MTPGTTQCDPPPEFEGTTRQRLFVTCGPLPQTGVDLRIVPRLPDTPDRGTVVLGRGCGGQDLYEDVTGGDVAVAELRTRGFRVVERRWGRSWFADGFSVRKPSCRYATLLHWIQSNVHVHGGAFCVSGNPGGGPEPGYALTAWGFGDVLDVAVTTGGPVFTRIDCSCNGWPPGSPCTWSLGVPDFRAACRASARPRTT